MGRIEDLAKRDVKRITGDVNIAGTEITFESNDSPPVVAVVAGRAAKVHKTYQDWSGMNNGVAVNEKTPYIGVSEDLLLAEDYPVRNDDKEVNLKDHKVSWKDSTGETWTYKISEWHPDETLGYIRIYLKDFE